jgi:uncharacterized cupredoxin-like copper-binding protein
MKANTRERSACRRLRHLTVLGAVLAVLLTGACGGASTPTPTAKPKVAKATAQADLAVFGADKYLQNPLDFNGAVDWTLARTVHIELGEMYFKPKDLVLQAGVPYLLELKNNGGVEHEFTAATFFRSSSIRKIESDNGEVRVPFFTGIKVQPGKTVTVFAIPVVPGKFEMLCEIPKHREAGMEGTIMVVGHRPTVPVPVIGKMKDGPWLPNAQAIVKAANWNSAKTVQIEAGEGGPTGMYFKPKHLALKVGTPYVIRLVNKGSMLHEYTADDFFPTVAFKKAQDAAGEYTSPLIKEAEVKAGQELDVYLIPTQAGSFKVVCKLQGHESAGMVGTIDVS